MKKLLFTVIGVCLLALQVMAQAPQKFNYQGVARTSAGEAMTSQNIGLRVTIKDGSPNGATDYQETHSVTTNDFGLYNVEIGDGNVEAGNMNNIDWSSGSKYIQVEIDPNGGANYTDLGTSQLLSVPYALYAGSGDAWGFDGNSVSSTAVIGTTNLQNVRFVRNGVNSGIIGNTNVALGNGALPDNSGSNNTALGSMSLTVTSGSGNSAVGRYALSENTTGNENVGVGFNSLKVNETGNFNIAVGASTLESNTDGGGNVAVGRQALNNNTSGDYNTGVGLLSLHSNTEGDDNVAVGRRGLYSNTTGDYNVSLGYRALFENISGNNNIGIGKEALASNTLGGNNVIIGFEAGKDLASSGNVAIGALSLGNGTGTYNTTVGYLTNFATSGDSHIYSGAFGYNAKISATDQFRIGNPTYTASIGGRVSWTTVSDGRFKTDVEENIPGLAFIKELRPVSYKLDTDGIGSYLGIDVEASKRERAEAGVEESAPEVHTGFIAQEVEAAAEKIGFDFHGVDKPKNENDYYGIRYAEFVVPLVKAVQEQQEIIDNQNERIQKLEEQLQQLLDK